MNSITLPEQLAHPPAPGEPIDEEIWPLVVALNESGVQTNYSCGGHGGWPFVAWEQHRRTRDHFLAVFLAQKCVGADFMVWPQLVYRCDSPRDSVWRSVRPFWMLKIVAGADEARQRIETVAGWVREFARDWRTCLSCGNESVPIDAENLCAACSAAADRKRKGATRPRKLRVSR